MSNKPTIETAPARGFYHDTVTFGKGLVVHFRSVEPGDAPLLREFMAQASDGMVLAREERAETGEPAALIRDLVESDLNRDMVLVGLGASGGGGRVLAAGRYFLNSANDQADLSLAVCESCRRRGLGTYLLRTLLDIGRARGVRRFTTRLSPDNPAMTRLVQKCAGALDLAAELERTHGIYQVSLAGRHAARTVGAR